MCTESTFVFNLIYPTIALGVPALIYYSQYSYNNDCLPLFLAFLSPSPLTVSHFSIFSLLLCSARIKDQFMSVSVRLLACCCPSFYLKQTAFGCLYLSHEEWYNKQAVTLRVATLSPHWHQHQREICAFTDDGLMLYCMYWCSHFPECLKDKCLMSAVKNRNPNFLFKYVR